MIASLALFVALGGTAYSALRVTGKQVVNGSLTGRDVRDGSIRRADLGAGVFAPTATPTPAATQSPSATPTATPVPGGPYTKIVTRFTSGAPVDDEVTGDVALCKDGEVATGGGVMNNSPSGNGSANVPMVITNNFPGSGPDPEQTGREASSWQGEVKYAREFAGQPLRRPIVYVICASR